LANSYIHGTASYRRLTEEILPEILNNNGIYLAALTDLL